MSVKRIVCVLVLSVCLLPSFALAAKSYNSTKIHSGEISTDGLVFKSGDKITGGKGISVSVYYADAAGNVVSEGNGTIKTVTIDGEKINEWVMTQKSGSSITLGNRIYQAAYGFTLKPTYAVADQNGYYLMAAKTYSNYANQEKNIGRKVKFTGRVAAIESDYRVVAISDNVFVAIKTEEGVEQDEKLNCKGIISEYVQYSGSEIPVVACDEVVIQQYEPLKKGDKGDEVLAMKERMQELGYFSANAELSNAYNDTCVERVKMFQKNNGLSATGAADAETLSLLYSDAAKSK